ncbi:hypothetical protein [Halosimplex marinum]|uniref:hypothetical protein n=1 Tax=Halosimplex marinum TaxID=3396620 RepID=UPI003F5756CB
MTLVTVTFLWIATKLILSDAEPQWIGELGTVYKLFVFVVAAKVFWPGLAHSASTVVGTMAGVVG